MNKLSLIVMTALLATTGALSAQASADSAAIRATVLDYIDGWDNADGARMERALHPELANGWPIPATDAAA
jgi:hypothetical protein